MNISCLGQLNLMLDAVSSSLRPPATLEYFELKFCLTPAMQAQLYALSVWSELDSLASGPLYARLQGVHVRTHSYYTKDQPPGPPLQSWLPQILPRLASKGILHVEAYYQP